ncbi:hypothetical protein NFJ02_07g133910 [Pycnococcus provasolii]
MPIVGFSASGGGGAYVGLKALVGLKPVMGLVDAASLGSSVASASAASVASVSSATSSAAVFAVTLVSASALMGGEVHALEPGIFAHAPWRQQGAARERRGLFGTTQDDWAGSSGRRDGGSNADYAEGAAKRMSSVLFGGKLGQRKEYPLPQRGLLSVFAPKSLAIVVFRTHAMHVFPLVEQWIKKAEENERNWDGKGDPPPWPKFPEAGQALSRARKAACREVVVTTTRRVFERICTFTIPRRYTWKLMKDVWESAMRKQRRLGGGWSTAVATGRTAMRAAFLGVLADLSVTQACCLYAYGKGIVGVPLVLGASGTDFPPVAPSPNDDDTTRARKQRRRTRWLVRQTCQNCARAGACLTAIGAGATLGTSVRPGLGTFLGSHVGDVAAATAVAMALDPWVRAS